MEIETFKEAEKIQETIQDIDKLKDIIRDIDCDNFNDKQELLFNVIPVLDNEIFRLNEKFEKL
ncbi:MAG TPA: hypothetical protein DEP28_03625 [Bacteroidetes bacterium]|nr:hypothetical protein [Bacteroidota bacterium]HCN36720.1 hypothetical protein [Bacteroidota bacterium]HRE42288.1 hypothetical protein [Ignavibacteria bacterium]